MSDPSKIWAIMTARALQMSQAPGGTPFLTPAQAAQLLQGLSPEAFLAGMVKECHDLASIVQLELKLWDWACHRAAGWVTGPRGGVYYSKSEEWPRQNREAYARRLAGLAVYELLIPNPNRCSACAGRGYTIVASNGVDCERCGSTGGKRLSERSRSELVCITWSRWTSGWQKRYQDVYSELEYWHGEARVHVARAEKGLRAFA